MRFCDFFMEYKIGLKKNSEYIPWSKLPLYRKIFLVIMFIYLASLIIFFVLQNFYLIMLIGVLCVLSIAIFLIIESRAKKQIDLLKNYYKPYSNQRITMIINLLNTYNIMETDTERIDLLIAQAKESQIKMDPLLPLKKPFCGLFTTILLPIATYIANIVADTSSTELLIITSIKFICIAICIFGILIALSPFIKDLIYKDYSKYEELIYDLNQIKIFQPQKINIYRTFKNITNK